MGMTAWQQKKPFVSGKYKRLHFYIIRKILPDICL